mgnify:CR=1 FL=1
MLSQGRHGAVDEVDDLLTADLDSATNLRVAGDIGGHHGGRVVLMISYIADRMQSQV